MNATRRLLLILMLLACSSATSVTAQKPKLITEAGYATVISGRTDDFGSYEGPARFHLSAAVGFVKPMTPQIGLGGILSVGVWDDFYLAVGPRLRFHASEKVAVDITPSLILDRGNENGKKGMIDIAAMYKDQIGFAVQVGSFPRYLYGGPPDYTFTVTDRPAVFAGFKLGGKPGRYGILADAVALAGAFGLFIIACASNGCD